MTVQSGFFSDGSSYNQADFNAFLLDSIGSGYVLGYENELRVTQNSPANMGVIVRTGRCYVQGYYGWVTGNEALTVPNANATHPRIDRVVARLSVSVNQSVTFAVLVGTPAANPSPPALTRTSETYEISLARIYVGAGVTSITAANITDERGDATVCGVAGVKHSWQYLTNVAIDVSGMSVDAGASDRDPVYFNGTKWVVATQGAIGFYDYRHDAVITAGYLDGFTGLTPGEIVSNRGVAISATEIVVLESPVDASGYKQIGDAYGDLTGFLRRDCTLSLTSGDCTIGAIENDSDTVLLAYSSNTVSLRVDITKTIYDTAIGTDNIFRYDAPPVGSTIAGNLPVTVQYATDTSVFDATFQAGTIRSYNSSGTLIQTLATPAGHVNNIESVVYNLTTSVKDIAYVKYDVVVSAAHSNTERLNFTCGSPLYGVRVDLT